jgi:hypothetical protein
VEISGTGTSVPQGVTIPGAYRQADPGLTLLNAQAKYVVPGPQLYQGKYDAPTGSPAVVKNTGDFPGSLQKKYQDLSKKFDGITSSLLDSINTIDFVSSKSAPPSMSEVFQMLGNMGGGIATSGSLYGDIQSFKAEVALYKASTAKAVKRFMA